MLDPFERMHHRGVPRISNAAMPKPKLIRWDLFALIALIALIARVAILAARCADPIVLRSGWQTCVRANRQLERENRDLERALSEIFEANARVRHLE